MRHGKFLIINCGKSKEAGKILSENVDGVWPSNTIFSYDEWNKDDVNNSIVKEGTDEDTDHMGGKGFHR